MFIRENLRGQRYIEYGLRKVYARPRFSETDSPKSSGGSMMAFGSFWSDRLGLREALAPEPEASAGFAEN